MDDSGFETELVLVAVPVVALLEEPDAEVLVAAVVLGFAVAVAFVVLPAVLAEVPAVLVVVPAVLVVAPAVLAAVFAAGALAAVVLLDAAAFVVDPAGRPGPLFSGAGLDDAVLVVEVRVPVFLVDADAFFVVSAPFSLFEF